MDTQRRQIIEEATVRRLESVGALLQSRHIVYAKGGHGHQYVDVREVLPFPRHVGELGTIMAEFLHEEGVETVIGPAMGAVTLAYATAKALLPHNGRHVSALFAEKDKNGAFTVLRPEFIKHVMGRRVAIIEDVWTTGGSTRDVADLVRHHGGAVVAAVAVWNRMETSAEKIGVPRIEALVNRRIESFPAETCPLCRDGVPINTEVGHGAAFLAAQQKAKT